MEQYCPICFLGGLVNAAAIDSIDYIFVPGLNQYSSILFRILHILWVAEGFSDPYMIK